jgi:hypothetical protein
MPNPKRRFWQIHLSTAVVLMFASGIVLMVNSIPFDYGQLPSGGSALDRGWPIHFHDEPDYSDIHPVFVAFDVGAAATFLAVIYLFCEYLIRRREARKP